MTKVMITEFVEWDPETGTVTVHPSDGEDYFHMQAAADWQSLCSKMCEHCGEGIDTDSKNPFVAAVCMNNECPAKRTAPGWNGYRLALRAAEGINTFVSFRKELRELRESS